MKQNNFQPTYQDIQEVNNEADSLVAICEKDDSVGVSLLGDHIKIAKALFVAIHDETQTELAGQIYEIIKNVTYNIISNESPYKDDMVLMLYNELSELVAKGEYNVTPLIIKGEA